MLAMLGQRVAERGRQARALAKIDILRDTRNMRISGDFFLLATIDQVADLLRAISTILWPVVAVIFLVLFRAPITELFRRLTRAKLLGQEAEFDLLASRVQRQVGRFAGTEANEPGLSALGDLAASSPTGAIIEAHAHIDRKLRALLEEDGIESDELRSAGAVELAQMAQARGIVTALTANGVEALTLMSELAAHQGATEERAQEYLLLAKGVVFAIQQNARSRERQEAPIAGQPV
jgi:hypothetical protein